MLLLILALTLAAAVAAGAPYVPSKQKDLEKIFRELGPGRGHKFVDLGCGHGQVLERALEHGYKAVGYEINPILSIIASLRVNGAADVRLLPWQLADLSQFDVIYIFSTSWHLKRINKSTFPETATVVIYGPQPSEWDQQRQTTACGPAIIYYPVARDSQNKLP